MSNSSSPNRYLGSRPVMEAFVHESPQRPAGHVVETQMRKAGILWSNTLCGVLHVNAGD